MQNSKRQILFASLLALCLFLVPNLFQDFHRISGHQTRFDVRHAFSGLQVNSSVEKCPVCVFEFNIVEEITNFVYIPVLKVETFVQATLHENHVQFKAFHYYNLRAPPVA